VQVVDNSSAFRMTEGVPLVIPEVNAGAMAGMRAGRGGIVANPNCSTIIALMAVTPLHRAARVKRMVISTYQARPPGPERCTRLACTALAPCIAQESPHGVHRTTVPLARVSVVQP
jgi:hypothetical protein